MKRIKAGTREFNEVLGLPGDGTHCTAAVIFNDEGKILLGLRHYKKKWQGELIANSLWTTPGGRSDEGETVGECLSRETKEETSLQVRPVEYWGVIPAARTVDTLHVFKCEHEGELKNLEPHKFGEWQWFKVDEIPENFINPRLKNLLNAD